MRRSFRSEGRRSFDMPFFQTKCLHADAIQITDALGLLAENGIVHIFYADDLAYVVTFDPDAEKKLARSRALALVKAVIDRLIGFLSP